MLPVAPMGSFDLLFAPAALAPKSHSQSPWQSSSARKIGHLCRSQTLKRQAAAAAVHGGHGDCARRSAAGAGGPGKARDIGVQDRVCRGRTAWNLQSGAAVSKRTALTSGLVSSLNRRAQAHSITSSAAKRRVAGTSRLSARATFRFMANSNLVGCCTGKEPACSPCRIRLT